jgi:hypothetical protein
MKRSTKFIMGFGLIAGLSALDGVPNELLMNSDIWLRAAYFALAGGVFGAIAARIPKDKS